MIRLLGWLGLVTPVWLTDFRGEVRLSIKRRHPNPKYAGWARVYHWTGIGYVLLNHGGTCEENRYVDGVTCYMRSWTTVRPRRKQKEPEIQRLHRLTSEAA